MNQIARLSDNGRGALWMLVSVAGATAMTLSIRVLTPDLHTVMLAFLRSAFAVLIALPFLLTAWGKGEPLSFSLWPRHLLRGFLMGLALNSGFYAIWQLPMAQATILFFMAPVFATVLAVLFAGESVGPRRWAAIGVGFLGAVVILRPGTDALEPAMAVALLSSVFFASSLILGRTISAVDGTSSVFVSTTLLVPLFTFPPALFFWKVPVEIEVWAVIGVLVLASALRMYADIRAYAIGEAGFLAPFSYLRLLTIGVAGYVWFGEVLDGPTIAGGAIIAGATLYISLRESRLRRASARTGGGTAEP